MQIEIVAIGDEVLRGAVVNSNAAWMSRHLLERGFSVARHTALPDDLCLLESGLKEALSRSSLVITTGGLGSTCDDHTRQVAAKLFGSDFHFNEQVASDLCQRFGDGLQSLKDQATVPSQADLLLNRIGTAPGLIFSKEEKMLILLPGVPQEMEQMLLEQVIPYLIQRFPHVRQKISIQMHFCHLYESLVDPILRELKEIYPAVEVGIYPGLALLTVSLHAEEKAQAQIEGFCAALKQRFATYLFSMKSGKIEQVIHDLFLQKKKRLALAESCTGGMMAARLTALPGASAYFLGSLVVYSNQMKQDLLGVSEKTLGEKGAVSRETVVEMLEGVFERTEANFGIAVVGIAGPSGGSKEKPVGTVWAALGERGQKPDVGTFLTRGDRQMRISSTTNHLFGACWRLISQGIAPFPFFQ
jgi:nicotinamide-nucleotide amidase